MENLLIIIPAYNEAASIEKVIKRLENAVPETRLLVVDDGSKDGTFDICRRLQKRQNEDGIHTLSIVRHRCNIGLAGAIKTGMKYALKNGFDYALQFDGDGQHDENAIPDMLKIAVREKSNIVIGSRFIDKKYQLGNVKKVSIGLISSCIRLTSGGRIADPTSGMRMYDRKIMERFVASTHYTPEPDMLAYVIRKGAKVSEIPVKMRKRESGRSYLDKTESVKYLFRICASILLVQWFR